MQVAIYKEVARVPDWIPSAADGLIALAIVLVLVDRLKWWQRTGIGEPPRLPRLWIAAALPALIVGFSLGSSSGIHVASAELWILAIIAAVSEEFLDRGLILSALAPTGVRSSVVVSSLLFGLAHLDPLALSSVSVWLHVVETASHGALWAAVRLRTGSIWPGVVGHALFDLVALSTTLRLDDLSLSSLGLRLGVAAIAIALAAFLLRSSVFAADRTKPSGSPTPAGISGN